MRVDGRTLRSGSTRKMKAARDFRAAVAVSKMSVVTQLVSVN
jgi:hypothetical protein